MLPKFLIIGAQRAGSTWLYRSLRQHPEVFLPERKEIEFFSYNSGSKRMDVQQYEADYFSAVPDGTLPGEASPSYFWAAELPEPWNTRPRGFEADIPGRVHATLGPDTRLVLSLRDPVERAVSAFLHHLRRGRLSPDARILDAGRKAGIVGIGFYGAHMARWLQSFPRAHFWVGRFDEIVTAPKETYASICEFLGIDAEFRPDLLRRPANRGIGWQWQDGAVAVAEGQTDVNDQPLPAGILVTQADVVQLRELYADDLRLLADIAQVDVGPWLPES